MTLHPTLLNFLIYEENFNFFFISGIMLAIAYMYAKTGEFTGENMKRSE
jgi:hypothetical protein